MDLAFLRRAERMLARDHAEPALDYGILVAALAAHQAASPAARAAELLSCGPAWRRAARAQRGSFNARAALAPVNMA
jgi:hypothetical protein